MTEPLFPTLRRLRDVIVIDLAERAMSIRVEQATVPPSRYDMALRTTRRSVVEAQRLARRLHGQGWDARFPD